MVNHIDSIFQKAKKPITKSQNSGLKQKQSSSKGDKGVVKTATYTTPSKKQKLRQEKGSSSDPFSLQQKVKDRSLEYTEEGWKIYTPEELNIGKGGDTELCPFDCKCCF